MMSLVFKKWSLHLILNKAATIVLNRILSLHAVWFSHINICVVTKQMRDKTTRKVNKWPVTKATLRFSPLEIRCEHFGFSIQVAFLEVRKRDLRLLFLLNHTNILFLSTWVFELHRNLILTFTKWGRGNTRNYFRSRSTMQLPFTKYNFHSRSTTCFNIFFTTIPHSVLPAWIS